MKLYYALMLIPMISCEQILYICGTTTGDGGGKIGECHPFAYMIGTYPIYRYRFSDDGSIHARPLSNDLRLPKFTCAIEKWLTDSEAYIICNSFDFAVHCTGNDIFAICEIDR